MNLYFQILTQNQTSNIARLLLLPGELQNVQSACDLKISTGGKVRNCHCDSSDKAIAKLLNTKFNQVEASYSIVGHRHFRLPGRAVSIVGVFSPSPSSELWFRSEDWPEGGERATRTRKMNAKAAEMALSYYKVKSKPSVFEVAIAIDTAEEQDKVLDSCAEWIAEFIPNSLDCLNPFGCADAGGAELFVKLESNVLMTEDLRIMAKLMPPQYPELGRRLDALHPVMFGSKKLCNGIATALPDSSRLIRSTALSDFSVVRFDGKSETASANRRASVWILGS